MTDSDISPPPAPIKRYYYGDPLAAAWMAKHFDMTFLYQENDRNRGVIHSFLLRGFVDYRDIDKLSLSLNSGHKEIKFYIHPDSLPLLEP